MKLAEFIEQMAITNLAEKLPSSFSSKAIGDEFQLTSTESQRKEEKTSEPSSKVTSAQIRIRQKDRITTAATLQESCSKSQNPTDSKSWHNGGNEPVLRRYKPVVRRYEANSRSQSLTHSKSWHNGGNEERGEREPVISFLFLIDSFAPTPPKASRKQDG
ncbi:hypothetical protein K0M31_020025 [Melipona bicolor]|uniref:Uncharacterized protein n=1 Tax=Melipona bicolor TaxID=60889 RepID=A0AA40G1H6_9HYME|nr:hypothetical protein K0M31_020025 [Melipona bicolor]